MLFAKVRKNIGERIRRELVHKHALAANYKVKTDSHFVYFPVTKRIHIQGVHYIDIKTEPEKKRPRSIVEFLEERYGKITTQQLTKSFDIVGDIAIVEIPDRLKHYEQRVAEAVMAVHPNVKVVAKKLGAMSGEFRVRPLEVIGGENRTETIHKENDCMMKVDVARAYFSVRLSTERTRIANLVKDGENVLVMFSGVGPFALVIAKRRPDAKIACIELNDVAVQYANENVKLNALHNIENIQGDVKDVVPRKFFNWADRVVMPLPKSSHEFLDLAFKASRNNATIHLYHIGDFENAEHLIQKVAKENNAHVTILGQQIVRPYAPRLHQICVDFRVKKN